MILKILKIFKAVFLQLGHDHLPPLAVGGHSLWRKGHLQIHNQSYTSDAPLSEGYDHLPPMAVGGRALVAKKLP